MLSKVGTWNFDIFLFDRLTNGKDGFDSKLQLCHIILRSKGCSAQSMNTGNSLVTLMCHLFNVYGLIHHFQLDMVKLHRFLGKLQGQVCENDQKVFSFAVVKLWSVI